MVEFALIAPLVFFTLLTLGGLTVFTVKAVQFGALVSADIQDGSRNAAHRYRVPVTLHIPTQGDQDMDVVDVMTGETVREAMIRNGYRAPRPVTWTEVMVERRNMGHAMLVFEDHFPAGSVVLTLTPRP